MNSQQRMANIAALVVIGVSVLAVPALADCPEFLGSVDTPGSAMGVAVAGSYAYVADADSGLRVIDVSTPSMPVEVGFVDTPGQARGVAVSGSYAYVADRDAGLRVIDVSTPSMPVAVGLLVTPGWSEGVVTASGYVYLADQSDGLAVFLECGLFSDGFESGDTSAWSATVP